MEELSTLFKKSIKPLLKFIQHLGKRSFQVIFSLLFSLGPFILLSTLSSIGSEEQTWRQGFDAFFKNGEVAFMIISISGLIVWNSVFKHKNKIFMVTLLFGAVVVIFVAAYFANLPQQEAGLLPAQTKWLWFTYIGSLIIWWLALLGTASEAEQNFGEKGSKRVDKLLEEFE